MKRAGDRADPETAGETARRAPAGPASAGLDRPVRKGTGARSAASTAKSIAESELRAAPDVAVVRLVPARPMHAEAWFRWRQEPISRRFNPILPATVESLAERLSRSSHDLTNQRANEHRWIVDLRGVPIGTVALVSTSWTMGYSEIGYMLSESHQGRGLGTVAVSQFVAKIFRESSLDRLFATISVENAASIRLVTRLGFTREGLLREHFLIEGRRVDELVYGILRREWSPPEPPSPAP